MKILVAYPTRSSFVARDIRILSEKYPTSEVSYYSFSFANQTDVVRAVARCDLVLLWFASQRAVPLVLAARAMRKPVATIVGGYEAAACPEINYGSARNRSSMRVVRWILDQSDAVAAVSHSSLDEIVRNLGIEESRLALVRHGFEVVPENMPASAGRKKSVVTVGLISDSTWFRKGAREFVMCAESLTYTPFIHVGSCESDVARLFGKPLPSNLTFTGRVSDDELHRQLSEAAVYLQLSRHEAFGCSVAEAMLFGCVPVVSNRYALPEVVGNAGFVVDLENPQQVIDAVSNALEAAESDRVDARNRILTEFPLSLRQSKLTALVESIRA